MDSPAVDEWSQGVDDGGINEANMRACHGWHPKPMSMEDRSLF